MKKELGKKALMNKLIKQGWEKDEAERLANKMIRVREMTEEEIQKHREAKGLK